MERAELSQCLRPWLGQVASSQDPGSGLISEADPAGFMAAFAQAVAGEGEVFLGDPSWGANERAQVDALLKSKTETQNSRTARGWLMIPSGGTSGKLKFARHDQDTLAAAVAGFRTHFGLDRVNAVGLLPLHHVSGFMAWMRCALSGGRYESRDWKRIEAGVLPELPEESEGWVLSLVPTQLERLLSSNDETAVVWLRRFRIIFLGGAPASPGLLDRAAGAGLRISLGYGMTETAAMVTALKPEEFLGGLRSSGAPLPHARAGLTETGLIRLGGDSLFRGYYPEWRDAEELVTADLGRIDEHGHLHVLGRSDGVIITGGEKVLPAEVEAALRATGEFSEVVVVGVPDAEWGQVVVAAYPASARPDLEKTRQVISSHLSAWKRPKRYVPVEDWPRNAQGKVNRGRVAEVVGRGS